MLKPLTQRLNDSMSPSTQLDPALVAGSFGVAYPPNEPLPPEGPFITHAWEEDRENPLLDRRPPQPKEPPRSLHELVQVRLRSLKALCPAREKEIEKVISKIYNPLKSADEFIEAVEQERLVSLGEQWERKRQEGREILESIHELIGDVNLWLQQVNRSEKAKADAATLLQNNHLALSRMSKWVSAEEIAAAEEVVESNRAAKQAADEKWLGDMRAFAEAQSKLRNARMQVEVIEQEMSRLDAEITGQQYHDPKTGLSINPIMYRDSWQ